MEIGVFFGGTPCVGDLGGFGPHKERKDEHDSQTRPQEFMQPQDENPYLHTSDWIQLSRCLHIAFALETE